MATKEEIAQSLEETLQRLPSGAIRVGFEDSYDLKGLSNLLDQKFSKLIKHYGELGNKVTKEIISNTNKNFDKEQSKLDKEKKEQQKRQEELVKALKQKDDNTKNILMGMSTFLNLLNKTIKGFTTVAVNQLNYVETLRTLNSSGAILSDGFQSLSATAIRAGMTSEEFAKRLASVAPTLAKLNAIVGNGAKLYADNFKKMQQYGLTNDEIQNALTAAINKLTPAQLQEMERHNTLSEYIDKTTKRMIELRDATGKSIEIINQENEIKNRELRLQAWTIDPKNKRTWEMLQSIGLGDAETVDFLRTGIPSERLALAMAGNKDNAYLLNSLRNVVGRGQELTPDVIARIQKEVNPMYLEANRIRLQRAENAGIYAGAQNEQFQNFNFLSLLDGLMNYNTKAGISTTRQEDIETLGLYNDIRSAAEVMKESYNEVMRGGYDSVKKSMELMGAAAENLNEILGTKIPDSLNYINDKLGALSGTIIGTFTSGFGGSILDGIGYAIGSYITGKVGSKISKVVPSIGNKVGIGKIASGLKNTASGGLNVLKNTAFGGLNGIINSSKVGGAMALSKLGGAMKLFPSIVSLIQSGDVLKDFATKGVGNSVQEIKDNWGGSDWINPSKMAAVAFDWIGEKAIDVFSPRMTKNEIQENANKIANSPRAQAALAELNRRLEATPSEGSIKTNNQGQINEQNKNKQNEMNQEIVKNTKETNDKLDLFIKLFDGFVTNMKLNPTLSFATLTASTNT